jgi:hypothetical protein
MKYKVLASSFVLAVAFTLLVGLTLHYQSVQASAPRYTVAIIGGVINGHKPSHITIATAPGAGVGMRIFYRCPSVIRTVYPNQHANVLGRYTWAWNQGAPCNNGTAVVIVNGSKSGQSFVTQKTFKIVLVPGVNGNPWGYDFAPGNRIYNPPATFCNYFACVSSFWTSANGYVAECYSGKYTHSDGVSGACSRNGGVLRPLYSHL